MIGLFDMEIFVFLVTLLLAEFEGRFSGAEVMGLFFVSVQLWGRFFREADDIHGSVAFYGTYDDLVIHKR